MRFFAGLKPLQPVAYASLLRAIAQSGARSGSRPGHARRATRSSGADRRCSRSASSSGTPCRRWRATAPRTTSPPGSPRSSFSSRCALAVHAGNPRWRRLAARSQTKEGDRRLLRPSSCAIRLEWRCQPRRRRSAITARPRSRRLWSSGRRTNVARHRCPRLAALPFARGMLLVRAERFPAALAVFDEILDLVPGHTLALQQAARCCVEGDALPRAEMYSRRAARRTKHGPLVGRTGPRPATRILTVRRRGTGHSGSAVHRSIRPRA